MTITQLGFNENNSNLVFPNTFPLAKFKRLYWIIQELAGAIFTWKWGALDLERE